VPEENCWAMLQAARRSCFDRSGSSAVKMGFVLDSLFCTYRYSCAYVHSISTCAGPPGTNYCGSLGVKVKHIKFGLNIKRDKFKGKIKRSHEIGCRTGGKKLFFFCNTASNILSISFG